MGCYSFYNEDFKEHALIVYECVKNDNRLPIIVRKFSSIINVSDIEGLVNDLILLTALLHDVGKVIKRYQDGDLKSFTHHDFVGALIMKEIIEYMNSRRCNLASIVNDDMRRIVESILITGPLFHLYLHRGKEESWRAYDIEEEIGKGGLEIPSECVRSILDTLNSFKEQVSKEGKALMECMAKAFESGKVNEYLKQYWRIDLHSIAKYYNEINNAKEYGWFFEGITAMINECDDEAARRRRG
ncbi:MAG: HD domain-containing protein [Vulcanisaeta sp.]